MQNLLVNIPLIPNDYAVNLFNTNKPLLLQALKMADSDIIDIEAKKEKVTVPVMPAYLTSRREVIPGMPAMQTETYIRFLTSHKKNSEIKFDLELEESAGTVQLFYMLITLLDVCKHGKTLVIDEFDLRLILIPME